jgi:hypothetical protein
MGMTTSGLTKPYTAGAAVAKRRFLKFGSADGTVIQAAGATDLIVGASTDIDAASGERCDTWMVGNIVEIDFGGTIARGASVTADSNGKAVTATTGQVAGGFAEVSGVSGDVGLVVINRHTAA